MSLLEKQYWTSIDNAKYAWLNFKPIKIEDQEIFKKYLEFNDISINDINFCYFTDDDEKTPISIPYFFKNKINVIFIFYNANSNLYFYLNYLKNLYKDNFDDEYQENGYIIIWGYDNH